MHNPSDFSPYYGSPEALANKVLDVHFGTAPSFPIDPFELLRSFNVVIQPRIFKGLEGVYLPPSDGQDFALVAINQKRPVTRQRFTASHELCHHIKDGGTQIICPIGSKNAIEKFAEKFAAYLLMPTYYLKEYASKFEKNGEVSFDDTIAIADYFGVSFEACVYALAYRLHKIGGETEPRLLHKRITHYHPLRERIKKGFSEYDIALLKNMISSCSFAMPFSNRSVWYRFKTDFIYNENRLENLDITHEQVAEITTDLRINQQNSSYCNSDNSEIIEVLGHSTIYDYIVQVTEQPSIYSIIGLHKLLYKYSPYPEVGGAFRTTTAIISGSKVEAVPYNTISQELYLLGREVQDIMARSNGLSITEYIDRCIKIHHRLTVIHPFCDGNGRISRAFLNWLFKVRKLPPIYIKLDNKQLYYDGLMDVDINSDYRKIEKVIYASIAQTLVALNGLYCE